MTLTPGQIFTRNNEGTYDQCEYPHVPAWWKYNSGITLGFGYDCRDRDPQKIMADLLKAGVSRDLAYEFAQAVGKGGHKAHNWLVKKGLDKEKFTRAQMDALFAISYSEIEKVAIRTYSKDDCKATYGWILDWESLLQKIRDEIVDITYRGDWRRASRRFLAGAIKSNHLEVFYEAMNSWSFWRVRMRVPKYRYLSRIRYLEPV